MAESSSIPIELWRIPMPGMEPRRRKDLLEGFPQTADFIAKDPAKTTVIFRRFDQLAVRNLLQLEARLAALENLQKDYDRDDVEFNNDNEPITTAARSWEDFAVIGTFEHREKFTRRPRDPGHDSPYNLPESVLEAWRIKRAKFVEHDKITAHQRLQPIETSTMDIKAVYEASVREECAVKDNTFDLASKAAIEAKIVYNNPLGCGPCSLALIRSRWELSAAIETSLKEYQEAVLRYREMLKLEPPAERTKTIVSNWIAGVHPITNSGEKSEEWSIAIMSKWLRKVFRQLSEKFRKSRVEEPPDVKQQFLPTSSMHGIYVRESSPSFVNGRIVGEPSPDLVGVGRIAGVDPLTRWVSTWRLLYIFKDKHFGYPEIDYVPEKVIHYTVTLLTVVLAVVMVIGGIWGLYLLRTEDSAFYPVLVLLSGLITLFAFLMKIVTTSSRTELFVATAGYAAVLVVFVAFQAPGDQSFGFILNSGTSGNGTIQGH